MIEWEFRKTRYLEHIPLAAFYARTRGWAFVVSWLHRISGILLTVFLLFHIHTLSLLFTPETYTAKMKIYGLFFFVFLEWLIALPVILHALNGGRLILYEIFGIRNDASMLRWVTGLAIIYVVLQALLMTMGNQSVSPVFFWLLAFVFSGAPVLLVSMKIRHIKGSTAWKLQRVSASLLLIMIPAHLLVMHLQPAAGHEAGVIIARMQHIFIKFVDLIIVISALYHAGYGLISISRDYITSNIADKGVSLFVIFVMVLFGWIGVKTALLI